MENISQKSERSNIMKKRKILFRHKKKFAANICTVYAETRLLLLLRICIASAPKLENSSLMPLLDDQL